MKREIIFKNQMTEVQRIAQFIDAIGEELHLDMPIINGIQLAIEEAVVNVINYAYPDRVDCESSLVVNADEHQLIFIVTDSGLPFDPTAVPEPDITLEAEQRPIGGLGILLIKKIMGKVSYQYLNGQNILTMTKKIC